MENNLGDALLEKPDSAKGATKRVKEHTPEPSPFIYRSGGSVT